jgi:hypothetical protein
MDTYPASSGPNKTFVFILGFVFGALLLGAGLYVYTNFFSSGTDKESGFKVTPTKEFTLSVTAPLEGETVSTEKVKISGSTGVASVLVVNGGEEDTIIETVSGAFSIDYGLTLGENQITVTAYEEDSGESRTKTLDILYLNEDLETL